MASRRSSGLWLCHSPIGRTGQGLKKIVWVHLCTQAVLNFVTPRQHKSSTSRKHVVQAAPTRPPRAQPLDDIRRYRAPMTVALGRGALHTPYKRVHHLISPVVACEAVGTAQPETTSLGNIFALANRRRAHTSTVCAGVPRRHRPAARVSCTHTVQTTGSRWCWVGRRHSGCPGECAVGHEAAWGKTKTSPVASY